MREHGEVKSAGTGDYWRGGKGPLCAIPLHRVGKYNIFIILILKNKVYISFLRLCDSLKKSQIKLMIHAQAFWSNQKTFSYSSWQSTKYFIWQTLQLTLKGFQQQRQYYPAHYKK